MELEGISSKVFIKFIKTGIRILKRIVSINEKNFKKIVKSFM